MGEEAIMYTAFISSTFNNLKEAREQVINSLLDLGVFPIAMEHFTVPTNEGFSAIEKLIDAADFFIMIMGKDYGSCDGAGISWSEREYDYVIEKGKPILAIKFNELNLISNGKLEDLDEQEAKQVEFSKKIELASVASSESNIKDFVSQFYSKNFSKFLGWSRNKSKSMIENELYHWREENKAYDIGGTWYHVHLNNDDKNYIRIGTITIKQEFTAEKYHDLHINGENYNINYYDLDKKTFVQKEMEYSDFEGEYTLQDDGKIFGIYNSRRHHAGTFNSKKINEGYYRGMHDLTIKKANENGKTERIDGEYHDVAPSPKRGRIFIFRDEGKRDEFLLRERESVIEKRQG